MTMGRLLAISALAASSAFAHCDSVDGPVVAAARRALASGDVSAVLPWIQPAREPAVREAFLRTLSVRKLNANAEALADTWFFETVVRVHREGEGATYDGLKPAGGPVAPAVRAADKAIASGDAKALEATLTNALQQGLQQRFHHLRETKTYAPGDVEAGRKYVAAYVDFIHFAERLEQALSAGAHHH